MVHVASHLDAAIGASNDPFKPGGRVIKNIKEHGYRGRLWAVNPKTGDIPGLPTYPSIEALSGAPDLAIPAISFACQNLGYPLVDELADKGMVVFRSSDRAVQALAMYIRSYRVVELSVKLGYRNYSSRPNNAIPTELRISRRSSL